MHPATIAAHRSDRFRAWIPAALDQATYGANPLSARMILEEFVSEIARYPCGARGPCETNRPAETSVRERANPPLVGPKPLKNSGGLAPHSLSKLLPLIRPVSLDGGPRPARTRANQLRALRYWCACGAGSEPPPSIQRCSSCSYTQGILPIALAWVSSQG
jgi:hypothetical protein